MNTLINTVLLVYAGLFPIVNPVGGAPIFLGVTRANSEAERAAIAARIAVGGFFLLLGSMFVGSHVLEFFGITLPVVRIAGGLVVSAFAWKLLHSGADPDSSPAAPGAASPARKPASLNDAFYPLTLPLTVGPGSIAVAITLGSQRPRTAAWTEFALVAGAAIVGVAAISVTVYICYRYAERLVAMLGESGTNVMVRLSAFILLCIGIQIVWSGWSALADIH
jgi:multiple antibiotic resistance protein